MLTFALKNRTRFDLMMQLVEKVRNYTGYSTLTGRKPNFMAIPPIVVETFRLKSQMSKSWSKTKSVEMFQSGLKS